MNGHIILRLILMRAYGARLAMMAGMMAPYREGLHERIAFLRRYAVSQLDSRHDFIRDAGWLSMSSHDFKSARRVTQAASTALFAAYNKFSKIFEIARAIVYHWSGKVIRIR